MASLFGDPGQWFSDVLSPVTGSGATKDAVNAQIAATEAANNSSERIYNQQREDLAPFREVGLRGLSGLEGDFMADWQKDPGYQSRLKEGLKAIDTAASARGGALGGATLKALTRYGQDYASNEYGKIYDRNFNRLSQLAGIGSGSNAQLVNASGQYGNQISSNTINQGNAIASANIAGANRTTGLLGQGLTAEALYLASDKRLKEQVKSINKSELNEMKKHLKAVYFNYKDEKFGKGQHAGILAQDLEKSKIGKLLVSEGEDGFKYIDLKKVMSMFLATMAEA